MVAGGVSSVARVWVRSFQRQRMELATTAQGTPSGGRRKPGQEGPRFVVTLIAGQARPWVYIEPSGPDRKVRIPDGGATRARAAVIFGGHISIGKRLLARW